MLFNQIDDENAFVGQMYDDEIIYKYFLHEAANGNKEIEKYVLKAFYNYYCADLELENRFGREFKTKDKYDEIETKREIVIIMQIPPIYSTSTVRPHLK